MSELKRIIVNEGGGYNFLGKILMSIFIALFAFLIVKIIDRIFYKKVINNKSNDYRQTKIKTVGSVFNSFVKVFVYVFAIIYILDFLGINTSSLLAVAGIGGVAIAFAAQSIVSDVIKGSFILFENQYNIGDWVTIAGKSGTVVEMGIRVVKLRDISGVVHIIPNGKVDVVSNHSKSSMNVIVELDIPLDKDYDRAVEVINGVSDRLIKESDLFITRPEVVGMTAMNSYRYTVRVQAPTENENYWPADRLMRQEYVKALQESNMVSLSTNNLLIEGEENGKL